MSATQPQSQTDLIAQTALATAQQLLPVILQGMTAGAGAASPIAATALALAPVVLKLISLHSDASEQVIAQMIQGMLTGVAANQAKIDAALAAKGVTPPAVAQSGIPQPNPAQ